MLFDNVVAREMKTRAKLVKIGRQEGRQEGAAQERERAAQERERAAREKLEGARKQKQLGISPEAIAAGFGLTPEEIAKL
jgi:predicted transposase YdaD